MDNMQKEPLYDFKRIGQRIKEERIKAGFTLDGLGLRINVSRQTISKWENDCEKASPSLTDFLRMCNVFQCELGYLLCEYDECKTRDAQFIHEYTGISEAAIQQLHKMSGAQTAFLNDLLTDEESFREIATAYSAHKHSIYVIRPGVAKYEADLKGKTLNIQAEIDGKKLPVLPIQDMEAFTRFNLQKAIVDFAEK